MIEFADPGGAKPPPPEPDGHESAGPPPFPIVGIGASAGGLEAASALLRALPQHPGMAFVLVQHLDPTHESSLAELLSHVSAMPVREATDGMAVELDQVYVIPPNTGMVLKQGALHLNPRGTSRAPQRPVDQFLRSLAEELDGRSIAVILSGTGTDGTLGVEAIKAAGGIAFAQNRSAGHAGMPQSAVNSGVVDFILAPEDIARELCWIANHPYSRRAERAVEEAFPAAEPEPLLAEVFRLLKSSCGVDFTNYKQPTLRRRLDRRMVLQRIDGLADYLALLRKDPAEVAALYEDVLIHVTRFFRDGATFDALAATVFPALLKERQRDAPIRIWVPGCSTGEEVYSLAIGLVEFLGEKAATVPIKIFGSDVSEAVVNKARAGHYPARISSEVSAQRLERFFVATPEGYQITKAIRDLCVFARQDANRDPPFSNLDLISCRNLLIYLGAALQKRLLPIFHYALREGGFLLLGKSEAPGAMAELFSVVDGPHRIHRRKSVPSRLLFDLGGREHGSDRTASALGPTAPPRGGPDLLREADRVVLANYAPAGVLVDESLEILQFRGDTGPYLRPAPGAPSHNLLKMAREGLLPELRSAVETARKQGGVFRSEGLRVRAEGCELDFNLVLFPIRVPPSTEQRYLVLFEEARRFTPVPAAAAPTPQPGAADDAPRREIRLERELAATREYLHELVQQHQDRDEELLAANEEILSSNEELQSTDEELQTAKEELQATNEELVTINEELRVRNTEAGQLNDDLTNLITSVSIPIVMTGRDLRIRRITPSACRVLNLLPSDVGRPITDIHLPLDLPDLAPLLLEVLDTLAAREREVQDREGRWYSLRLQPYRTLDNKVDGTVITLADVDAIKRSEAAAQALERKMQDTQKLESLGVLAGGIAHDFNNILTGILGNANVAGMDLPAGSSLRPHLESIEKGAERAAELCAQMLAYSGRGHFVLQALDLSELVRDTVHLLRHSVDKNAVFSFDLTHELPAVLADVTQIRQVLMNLVMNASEAICRERVNITIATGLLHADRSYLAQIDHGQEIPEGEYAYLEVRDDGCGMSPETITRIFDPFFTTKFTGRGLGLAAVLGIVRGHHGALKVDSVPSRGSSFRLLLPRAGRSAEDHPLPAPRASAWRGEGTVLVVDDEDGVRSVMTSMLGALGFDSIQARDGREALAIFGTHADAVRLVLLDLTMPNMGGEETFRALRQLRPDVCIVLMSGFDERDVVPRFAGERLGGFLPKPFRLGDLATKLRNALES